MPKVVGWGGLDGESAGARTQDQRLKRAMLYQLSYALKPHIQVSTFLGAILFAPTLEMGAKTSVLNNLKGSPADAWKALIRAGIK